MKKTTITILILTCVFVVTACKKNRENNAADEALYDEAAGGDFTYYQNGSMLSGVSPSPHGSFKLRFNPIAWAALDSTGELPIGNTFPNGSVIVKEIFNGSNIDQLAVMKKDPAHNNAGSNWIWAEFKPDGDVTFSTGKKGDGCIGCHSGTPNRDLTRTFDLH